MPVRSLLIASAVAAVFAAGWFALRPPQLEPIAASSREAAVQAAQPRVAASGAEAHSGPGDEAGPAARRVEPVRVSPLAPPPSLFAQLLASKEYRIFYDRLNGTPEGQTPEGRLALYELLRECANVTNGVRPGYRRPPPNRENFINHIPETDPQRERRIAAYDSFVADRCKGMEGISVTQADLIKLLDDAAAGGSAAARALRIEVEMMHARGGASRSLTDAQVASLQAAASSRDPEAVRVAGRVLSNAWPNYSLRIGPDQQPIEQRAFVNAFLVLACEYGAPCGEDTPRMLEACAMRGHCNAQNYPDYLHYYGSTPHESTLLMQYRNLVRHAIETGNWSQLSVVRNTPGNHRMHFVPGPR